MVILFPTLTVIYQRFIYVQNYRVLFCREQFQYVNGILVYNYHVCQMATVINFNNLCLRRQRHSQLSHQACQNYNQYSTANNESVVDQRYFYFIFIHIFCFYCEVCSYIPCTIQVAFVKCHFSCFVHVMCSILV